MPFRTIISAQELASHLGAPDWAVVDCRFDLKQPDWGYENYQQYHIPGAVYAHLDRDLSAPITSETGRHPLPDPEEMARRLGNWGIDNRTQVVVYDTSGSAYAARLWWQLRFLGHEQVAVLDGGFQHWQQAGLPLSTGIETRPPAVFIPHPNWQMVAATGEIVAVGSNPDYCLIDARSPERYRGEQEPIDPVAGHIPGAVNRFHGANLDKEGTFLPPTALREQFQQLIDSTPPQHVIVYCGSGVTSCHHILAMEIAGFPPARLYAGSWSEWIRDRKRPISS
jgi:thiosulfate/3-mercaptopyruvate sulfurtransferase